MERDKRKAVKLEYKQTYRPMGVYQIKNVINGKILIGSSPNLDGIKNRHWFVLKLGSHTNKTLQTEWNQYGEENFTFDIIEQIKPDEEVPPSPETLAMYQKELRDLEEKWLVKLQPYGEKGYL